MTEPATEPSQTIRIVVQRDGVRRWLIHLAERLQRRAGCRLELSIVSPQEPLPGALSALLALERLVHGRSRSTHVDRIAPQETGIGLFEPGRAGTDRAGLVVNLCGHPIETGGRDGHRDGRILQPRYDGALGDAAIAGAVFAGRSPLIEIEDVGAGLRLAAGTASLEAAGSTGAGMEAVFSRMVSLLEAVVAGQDRGGSAEAPADLSLPRRIAPAKAASGLVKALAGKAARAAYRLSFRAPHWRVGWRHTDRGIWDRGDLSGPSFHVLADPGTHFYADPFAIRREGRDFLFFEDLDHRVGKGIISCAEVFEDGRSGPVTPVLEEAWHLSYPFLIERDGDLYMIPESSANGDVGVYRCVRFPDRWERHATLFSGVEAADATIVEHGGLFWMFAVTRAGIGGYSDTLALFHAGDLFGPWQPHAANPVLVDPAGARPAGAMVMRNGALFRPVQDCTNGYGAALGLARVTRLDREGFSQSVETVLSPGPRWPGRKLHTLNRAGRLETIDGCVFRPRLDALAGLTDRHYRPLDAPTVEAGTGSQLD